MKQALTLDVFKSGFKTFFYLEADYNIMHMYYLFTCFIVLLMHVRKERPNFSEVRDPVSDIYCKVKKKKTKQTYIRRQFHNIAVFF